MGKTTQSTIDVTTLTRLEEHAGVAPRHGRKIALLAQQRTLEETLQDAKAILRQPGELDPVTRRKATEAAVQAEHDLQEVSAELLALQPELDAAYSQVRYTLKPTFQQEVDAIRAELAPAIEVLQAGQVRL